MQNGVRGLFTGLIPRVIKVAPACAIMIATFEHGKRFFQVYNANQILQYENDLQLLKHKRKSVEWRACHILYHNILYSKRTNKFYLKIYSRF